MPKKLTSRLGIYGIASLDAAILASLASNATTLLIGEHGSAKTLLIERLSKSLNLTFRHYNTSLLNYDDLVGYPIPNAEKKELEFIQTPGTIWGAEFILLDEISRARAEIQNKVFPIVHEHRIQGILLEDLEHCWSAMNPPSDSDDFEDSMYSGSWSLDLALADRFKFVLEIPSFSDLMKKDRENILRNQANVNTTINLPKLIVDTKKHLPQIIELNSNWTTKYLDLMIPKLVSVGLAISGRRASMLFDNIHILHSAKNILNKKTEFSETALEGLFVSLPHTACGVKIEKGKILLAHKKVLAEMDESPGSIKAVLREIKDPLLKVDKALKLGADTMLMTSVVSNALTSLNLYERYIWVYKKYPELSKCENLNASTMEMIALIQSNIVRGEYEECSEEIANGSRRWHSWEKICQAIATFKSGLSNVNITQLSIAKAIFFFEEDNVDIDDVVKYYHEISHRIVA